MLYTVVSIQHYGGIVAGSSIKNMVGQTWGRLTVLEYAGMYKRYAAWLCLCECGNEKVVSGQHLRNGATSSCGCARIKYSRKPQDIADRFYSNVEEVKSGCWEWTGKIYPSTQCGYFWDGLQEKQMEAYKWSYEYMVHEIPEGLELDHLCRNRKCVNPYHLDPVPHRENMNRIPFIRDENGRYTGAVPADFTK